MSSRICRVAWMLALLISCRGRVAVPRLMLVTQLHPPWGPKPTWAGQSRSGLNTCWGPWGLAEPFVLLSELLRCCYHIFVPSGLSRVFPPLLISASDRSVRCYASRSTMLINIWSVEFVMAAPFVRPSLTSPASQSPCSSTVREERPG